MIISCSNGGTKTSRDSGLTLVELLVYILLFGIVSAILATFLIRTLDTQSKIVDFQQTNLSNQSLDASLDIAIRNSSPKSDHTNVISGSGSGDQLLFVSNLQRAKLNDSDNTLSSVSWVCTYWYYDSSEAALFKTQTTSAIPVGYNPNSWSRVLTNIQPPTGKVFQIDTRSWDTTPTPTPTPTSTASAETALTPIRVGVDITTKPQGDGPAVRISTVYSGIGVDASDAIACRPGS